MSSGLLFVISAPSGTGKTTIVRRVMAGLPGLAFSISHTTRQPRRNEINGEDYHFVERDQFLAMRDENLFWEWAEVHENFYGTSKILIQEQLRQGVDIILDIDVQGAEQLKKNPEVDGVFIFISPPSWNVLSERLKYRATDSPETIQLRCENARDEMTKQKLYDYLIVNDELDMAIETLRAIIISERSRHRRLVTGQSVNLAEISGHDKT